MAETEGGGGGGGADNLPLGTGGEEEWFVLIAAFNSNFYKIPFS